MYYSNISKTSKFATRLFLIQYPIGSMITLNSKTDPWNYLGVGTWETSDTQAPYTFTRTK